MCCQHLVFLLVNLIWTSRLQNYKGINSCCFKHYFMLFFFLTAVIGNEHKIFCGKYFPYYLHGDPTYRKSSFLVSFHLLISHLYFSLLILPSSILQKRKPSFRKQKSFLEQVIGSPMESFFFASKADGLSQTWSPFLELELPPLWWTEGREFLSFCIL